MTWQTSKRVRPVAITPKTLGGLWAEWKEISASLTSEEPEREVRMHYTNCCLSNRRRPVSSWKELSEREARDLLSIFREKTGDAAKYRIDLMQRISLALCGDLYYPSIRALARFQDSNLENLTRAQHRALIEELFSQLARKEIVAAGDEVCAETVEHKVEELRKRFSPQRHGGTESTADGQIGRSGGGKCHVTT
jgi:hypothetical protein